MGLIEDRRKAREAIVAADKVIELRAQAMLARSRPMPPIEATPAQLELTGSLQQITVNVEWLAAALQDARGEGFSEGREIVQPLCDWANNSTKGWRDALAEAIPAAPELLELLDTILERA